MKKDEYERLFEIAQELNKNNNQPEAIEILTRLNNEPFAATDIQIKFLLGSSLLEINRHDEALPYFKKAVEMDEQSETASLGLYIIWAKKDRGDKAIEEMKRYLEKYPAVLYKSALEDLLCGLSSGAGRAYEEIILSLAAKNHIHHPQ